MARKKSNGAGAAGFAMAVALTIIGLTGNESAKPFVPWLLFAMWVLLLYWAFGWNWYQKANQGIKKFSRAVVILLLVTSGVFLFGLWIWNSSPTISVIRYETIFDQKSQQFQVNVILKSAAVFPIHFSSEYHTDISYAPMSDYPAKLADEERFWNDFQRMVSKLEKAPQMEALSGESQVEMGGHATSDQWKALMDNRANAHFMGTLTYTNAFGFEENWDYCGFIRLPRDVVVCANHNGLR